jgi:hypothetical protein
MFAIYRLIVYFLGWAISTFFETWHDYLFEKKLRKPDFDRNDLTLWKDIDSLEKGMFVLVFVSIEALLGMPWYYLVLFFFWNVWCRWLGHEIGMTLRSGRSFSTPGTTSGMDQMMHKFGITGWKFATLLIAPLIILSGLLGWIAL